MKKSIIILTFLLVLVGCNSTSEEQLQLDNYYATIETILDNKVDNLEVPFNYKMNVGYDEESKLYEYTIIIDKPQEAMYDIEALAIDKKQNLKKDIFPSIGIFDEKATNMVPNQTNKKKGFAAGIVLNGTTKEEEFTINLKVSWKNEKKEQKDVYIRLVNLAINDDSIVEE